MKKIRKISGILVIVAVSGFIVGCGRPKDNSIAIGSKNFTEQLILGNMYAELIEANTDLKVERKFNLGGTQPCYEALKSGSIDLYIEYSGTVDMTILKNAFEILPDKEVIARIKKQMKEQNQIAVLDEIGFNNAYCVAVSSAFSDEYGIVKISDLEKYQGKFRFSPSIEFVNREDGLESLENKYEPDFKEISPMEGGLKYIALESGETELIGAFTTDGMLKKYDLVVLEDDRQALVHYRAVPLVREETLEKYPKLRETIQMLSGKLTDSKMAELNYKVDEESQKPEDVAKEFLKESGFIK